MSPLELEFLLWCYYCREVHRSVESIPIRDFISRMKKDKVIESTDIPDVYHTTEKGEFWVKDILATPQPIQIWMTGR